MSHLQNTLDDELALACAGLPGLLKEVSYSGAVIHYSNRVLQGSIPMFHANAWQVTTETLTPLINKYFHNNSYVLYQLSTYHE